MKRDRCYTVRTKDGTELRVYAGKRPDPETIEALQAIVRAAYKKLMGRKRRSKK
jgi:hypothetical protein